MVLAWPSIAFMLSSELWSTTFTHSFDTVISDYLGGLLGVQRKAPRSSLNSLLNCGGWLVPIHRGHTATTNRYKWNGTRLTLIILLARYLESNVSLLVTR